MLSNNDLTKLIPADVRKHIGAVAIAERKSGGGKTGPVMSVSPKSFGASFLFPCGEVRINMAVLDTLATAPAEFRDAIFREMWEGARAAETIMPSDTMTFNCVGIGQYSTTDAINHHEYLCSFHVMYTTTMVRLDLARITGVSNPKNTITTRIDVQRYPSKWEEV